MSLHSFTDSPNVGGVEFYKQKNGEYRAEQGGAQMVEALADEGYEDWITIRDEENQNLIVSGVYEENGTETAVEVYGDHTVLRELEPDFHGDLV